MSVLHAGHHHDPHHHDNWFIISVLVISVVAPLAVWPEGCRISDSSGHSFSSAHSFAAYIRIHLRKTPLLCILSLLLTSL